MLTLRTNSFPQLADLRGPEYCQKALRQLYGGTYRSYEHFQACAPIPGCATRLFPFVTSALPHRRHPVHSGQLPHRNRNRCMCKLVYEAASRSFCPAGAPPTPPASSPPPRAPRTPTQSTPPPSHTSTTAQHPPGELVRPGIRLHVSHLPHCSCLLVLALRHNQNPGSTRPANPSLRPHYIRTSQRQRQQQQLLPPTAFLLTPHTHIQPWRPWSRPSCAAPSAARATPTPPHCSLPPGQPRCWC